MSKQTRVSHPIYNLLPTEIEGFDSLAELALDMRWSWNHATDEVWRQLDPELWEITHNPWVVVQTVSRDRIESVLTDPVFRKNVDALVQNGRQALNASAWFQQEHPQTPLTSVAYFSMEFMLSEALPIYSGGLGNVAGDQLKATSDLGVPVVGVGLLYQQGYFRQVIDKYGAQQALFPYNDPGQLPITPLRQANGEWLRLKIALPGYSVWVRAWQVQVGRVKLYLLDSNDAANSPVHRGITSELYGGGPELRLTQEILLGIGGWRLLGALGIQPEVCHLNEGHAAFAVLERARNFMEDTAQPFEVALAATRAGNLFTTHTAVAAGFDRFAPTLIEQYLGLTSSTRTVANLSGFFNLQTGPTPKIDAAIAQIASGAVDTSGNILLLGSTLTSGVPNPGAPAAGAGLTPTQALASPHNGAVAKSGRTTGLTCSTILGTNVASTVSYYTHCGDANPAFNVSYTDLIAVSGGNFSDSGDSGSLIVTQDTAEAVALLFAGSDTDTVGNPITDVLPYFVGAGNATPVFVGNGTTNPTHQVIGCTLPALQAITTVPQFQASSESIQQASMARDLHAPQLLTIPAIKAISVGASYDQPGQAAVLLFVGNGESLASIPRTLDGVRTRLIVGNEWAHRGLPERRRHGGFVEFSKPATNHISLAAGRIPPRQDRALRPCDRSAEAAGNPRRRHYFQRGFPRRSGTPDLRESWSLASKYPGGDRRLAHSCSRNEPFHHRTPRQ